MSSCCSATGCKVLLAEQLSDWLSGRSRDDKRATIVELSPLLSVESRCKKWKRLLNCSFTISAACPRKNTKSTWRKKSDCTEMDGSDKARLEFLLFFFVPEKAQL
jgi:hypothetical protein